MPLATLQSLTFVGVRPVAVQIEVHLSAGLPSFALVGLPDVSPQQTRLDLDLDIPFRIA